MRYNRVMVETENNLGLTLAAWLLTLIGWSCWVALVVFVDPFSGPLPLWAFFIAWFCALTGTAIPFSRYLTRRFSAPHSQVSAGVLLRQAIWFGLFGTASAWLLKSGLLGLPTLLVLLAGLIGIEAFLRLRERARWSPDHPHDPA